MRIEHPNQMLKYFEPLASQTLKPNSFPPKNNQEMSNPNSPTLDEVVGNIVKEVLRERTKQENQEIVHAEEVREEAEEIEVEVETGETRAFYSNKGAKTFKKHLAKKGFMEKRGFKKLVSPLKEEV